MKRPKLACLLLLTWAWAAPAWKTFRSPDGAFQVDFPTVPKRSQGLTRTNLGNVTSSIYSSSDQQGTYSVTFADLPGAAVKFSASQLIEDAKNKVLTEAAAQEVHWNGLELSYRSPKCQGMANVCLIGNRLLVLDARGKPGRPNSDWARPFFSSFKPLPERN